MRIAVLLTVFNRRAKTLACLDSLYSCVKPEGAQVDVFMVDGGSSDNTPEAVLASFPEVHLSIHKGLYWAGGMRQAWADAVDFSGDYDFFLLLNDDSVLYTSAMEDLLAAHDWCKRNSGRGGLYVGSTCDPESGRFTYGGRKLTSSHMLKCNDLHPDGSYQECQLANANILMVSREVYDAIGGLCTYATHSMADFDYSLRTCKAGFSCLVLPAYCGTCPDDHGNNWLSADSTLKQRVDFLFSPKGLAYHELLHFWRIHFPLEVPYMFVRLWGKTLFPGIWDRFKESRV